MERFQIYLLASFRMQYSEEKDNAVVDSMLSSSPISIEHPNQIKKRAKSERERERGSMCVCGPYFDMQIDNQPAVEEGAKVRPTAKDQH